MRLLCIFPWLTLGGADKFNLDMIGLLRERGWRITVATTLPHANPWRSLFEPLCEQIIDGGALPVEQLPVRLLVAAAQSHTLLVSNSALGYGLLPYLRAQLPQLACADYTHMLALDWQQGGYPRYSLNNQRFLDQQIVSSQQLRRWLIDEGANPARVAVCATNINTARWNPAMYNRTALRHELGLPPDSPVVLYAGRLERQKQPRLAVEVMRAVAQRLPQVRFLVAGDGQYSGFLRSYVRRHALEPQIRLLGAQSNERVRELLAASDLFFLPSENEGVSLALYEAMAMAVVPVSANVGGQSELVTPACGVLVERGPHEHAAYLAALTALLGNKAQLEQMGQAARAHVVAHFALQQMGERMDGLLQQAIATRRAGPRPNIAAGEALAAARKALHEARSERAALQPGKPSLRHRVRRAFWQAVDAGAWWLVPPAERLLGKRL